MFSFRLPLFHTHRYSIRQALDPENYPGYRRSAYNFPDFSVSLHPVPQVPLDL